MDDEKFVIDPLNDFQLFQDEKQSYFFANVDGYGVEGTGSIENTAKPYVQDKDGNPGVVTGNHMNGIPRDDNDENTYNTSDPELDPEFTYEETTGESEDEGGEDTPEP